MDVVHFSTSLVAFAEIVRIANAELYGDRTSVRVMVRADIQNKCFQVDLSLVMTLLDTAVSIFGSSDKPSIEELAALLGIGPDSIEIVLASGTVGAIVGFGALGLVKHLRGKKIDRYEIIRTEGKNAVSVRIDGDHNILIKDERVFNLYGNEDIRKNIPNMLSLLKEGEYDNMEIAGEEGTTAKFEEADAPAADGSDLPTVAPIHIQRARIDTQAKIRKAVYEGSAAWTLVYRIAIQAPIDDEEWLREFQIGNIEAPPGSFLDVKLEEVAVLGKDDKVLSGPHYRVKKVRGVILPDSNMPELFPDDEYDEV